MSVHGSTSTQAWEAEEQELIDEAGQTFMPCDAHVYCMLAFITSSVDTFPPFVSDVAAKATMH